MEAQNGKDEKTRHAGLHKSELLPMNEWCHVTVSNNLFFTIFIFSEGPEKNGSGDKKAHFPELHKSANNKSNKKKSPGGRTRCAFQPMKSPCLALNELKPGIEYKVVGQDGPVHMPTFKISVELDGNTFIGEGR